MAKYGAAVDGDGRLVLVKIISEHVVDGDPYAFAGVMYLRDDDIGASRPGKVAVNMADFKPVAEDLVMPILGVLAMGGALKGVDSEVTMTLPVRVGAGHDESFGVSAAVDFDITLGGDVVYATARFDGVPSHSRNGSSVAEVVGAVVMHAIADAFEDRLR